jgi:hypothetical protein
MESAVYLGFQRMAEQIESLSGIDRVEQDLRQSSSDLSGNIINLVCRVYVEGVVWEDEVIAMLSRINEDIGVGSVPTTEFEFDGTESYTWVYLYPLPSGTDESVPKLPGG